MDFPKKISEKKAGWKSRELTLTLIILLAWNKLTHTLDSIKNGQETTEH